LFLTLII